MVKDFPFLSLILPAAWRGAAVLLPLLCGCPRTAEQVSPPEASQTHQPPLRVLVVDDPGLAAAVERQWRARAEGEIEVRPMSTAELLDPRRKRLAADAVIYPAGLIGELAERELIVPISDDVLGSPELARRDIFDLLRQAEMGWGERTYAVPFGSPQLTLLYRRDLFEKLGLQPPESWAKYCEAAARLSNRAALGDLAPAEPAAWHGTVEPWGPGWAGQVLLARAAGYARHRNYFSALFDADTMEPLIAGPPFLRALEELVAAAPYCPPDAVTYGPAEARHTLLAGHCAMALTWPSHAEAEATGDVAKATQPVALAVAELPPSTQVYHPGEAQWLPRENGETGYVPMLSVAGRLGSVTQGAAQTQVALKFLLRLCSSEWSEQISPFSPATTVYRTSQIKQARAWVDASIEPVVAEQYAELVKQTQRRRLWLFSVRIPGRARYLAALDEAVQQSLRGEKPAAECLQAAAEQWRAITQEVGVESQRRAYARSLGMLP